MIRVNKYQTNESETTYKLILIDKVISEYYQILEELTLVKAHPKLTIWNL